MVRIRNSSRWKRGAPRSLSLLALASMTPCGVAAEGPPAIVVRAVRPDQQAGAVLKLFDGARAPSPAAAMAAWRRATADASKVGKPLQAVAAIFNPEMVAEWKAFDGVELAVGFDPTDARPRWRVIAPEDDGALAALITSLRLSGGGDEPPVGDPPVVVERLGGPGSAVGARLPEGVAFAGRRDELAAAVAGLRSKADGVASEAFETIPGGVDGSGFLLKFDPDGLGSPGAANLTLARIATAARVGGLKTTRGRLALVDDHLDLNLVTNLDPERRLAPENQPPAIDPSWLACVPVDGAEAAVTIALGRGAGFWNRVFEVADKVDRADPARAQLAPLRIRLNLLAAARGVRLEADLWPILRGVTIAAFVDPKTPGRTGGVLLALHGERPEDAARILSRVVAPLSGRDGGTAGEGAKPVALGEISARPLEATVRDSTVLVGWGDGTLERGLSSIEQPERSAATVIGRAGDRAVNRAGLYWPGRLASPLAGLRPSSPLAASLSEGSPVVWTGGEEGGRAWDLVRWADLRRLVARFLDRVPQAPPAAP